MPVPGSGGVGVLGPAGEVLSVARDLYPANHQRASRGASGIYEFKNITDNFASQFCVLVVKLEAMFVSGKSSQDC